MRECSVNTTSARQPCYRSHALRRWHHAERSDAALGLHAASLLASSGTSVGKTFGIWRSSCGSSVQSKLTRAGVAKHAVSQQQEPVAAAETPLRQKLAEFNRGIDTESGVLRILPLQARWLEDCAEMLADAFVDAKGIHAYKRFVRRQIAVYLESHSKMMPQAVVLMALLETPRTDDEGDEEDAANFDPLAGRSFDTGSFDYEQLPAVASSSPEPGTYPWVSNTETEYAASLLLLTEQQQQSSSTASPSSPSPSPGTPAASPPRSPNSQLKLVGTAEVSFDPATRTAYAMNNPPAKCAYLCNMAVHPDHRRQGIARHLLSSAEHIAALACEERMYLHLRLIDQPAGRLYRGSGFKQMAEDNFLMQLLGQDRKYLMCKELRKQQAPDVKL